MGSLATLQDAAVERERASWVRMFGNELSLNFAGLIRESIERLALRWDWVGLVERTGDDLRLTRLGVFALNAAIREHGGDALRDPMQDTPVEDILEVALGYEDDEKRDAVVAEWVTARGPEQAAVALVDFVRIGDATERSIAFGVIGLCGDPAAGASSARPRLADAARVCNWLAQQPRC